jgi:transposase
MVDIATIQDMELLRQVANLQQSEITRLHQTLQRLTKRLAVVDGSGSDRLQAELFRLQEQLNQRERALFGDKTERREGTEPKDIAHAKDQSPQRGHGPTEQPSLPIEPVLHTLDEADRVCPGCGDPLTEMGEHTEDAEEIDVVERHFVIKKHQRQKYKCHGCQHIETALPPVKLRPGNRYSIDFAVGVVVDKYGYHIPWERQTRMMAEQGLVVTNQTLWDQVKACMPHMRAGYEAIITDIKGRSHVGMDETWWRMMGDKAKTGSTKKWQVWGMCCEDAVFYKILNSRSTSAAKELLDGYGGIVMTDGYSAYQSLQKRGATYTLTHCWAHARRKFVDAEPFFPTEAKQMLDWVRQLYEVEDLCPRGPPEDEERLALRARLRDEQSRVIIKDIEQWLMNVRILPESSLGKAVKYARRFWRGLTRFLDDPRVELDNNRMERSLRGMALGRKNFGGTWSPKGAEAAQMAYTIVESAKLSGANPRKYLRHVILASVEDRELLLPRQFAEKHQESES